MRRECNKYCKFVSVAVELKSMQINYISYGVVKTGGYRHEKCLFDALCEYKSRNTEVKGQLIRRERLFETLFGYIDLMLWSFLKSNADINIVTARTGLSAILRNLFTKKEVWIVLHNYDENDGKSVRMRTYFKCLFSTLRRLQNKRFKIIVVAPFWAEYFKTKQCLKYTYLFPNLFDVKSYESYRKVKKERLVFFGQWSTKNDFSILQLANRLSQKKYHCYFATLDISQVKSYDGNFEIVYFPTHASYLENMSKAHCTLALTSINEGWNRIAHESLLVNTPVIGFKRGGLGDLLKESNSVIVNSIEEAYNCIEGGVWVLPDQDFFERYDLSNTSNYLEIVCSNHSSQF